jgi:arylsulfatase A-like enzyme
MTTWLVSCWMMSVTAISHATVDAKPPNILFILADDQSYRTVGCHPESWPWVRTPHLDALAKSGVRFQGAYLGAWCMPSRASLLTGKHPHAIQSMRMTGEYPGSTYDPAQCPFWPADFRRAGYQTAQIGKWHTGADAGFGRDWDYQVVWNRPKYPENAGAYYDRQRLGINGTEQWRDGYPADNYNRWAVEYVRGANRDPEKPWFLWLCHGSVHGPSKPAPRHQGRYQDAVVPIPSEILGPWPGKPDYLANTLAWRRDARGAIVAGKSGERIGDEAGGRGQTFADWVRRVNECVPAIDEGIGHLLEALRETGQLDQTLVVYSADQGFAMGEHGLRMKVAPYDASYRSPLIMSMPGLIAAGQSRPQTPNAPDLVATLHAIAGARPRQGMQGRDFSSLLRDPSASWPHATLYESTGDSFGDDVARLLRTDPGAAAHQKVPWYVAVVQDGWKYIHYLKPDTLDELYHLKSDPVEQTNLLRLPEHADRLRSLRKSLTDELKRTHAPELAFPPSEPVQEESR